jgi:RNA-directed DNA polymerase
VESGENRWSEGRQESGDAMTQDPKRNPIEVPMATPAGEADPYGWVERAVWTERMVECLRRGGPEGGRWYSLHDKVFAEKTLRAAYGRVAANGGAPGVDHVTVEQFGERLDDEISRLMSAWVAGTFRPQVVRRAWIAKPGTKERRPLGIPTVRDRVVQTALALVLEPIFEATFSERSYGFRPGRRAQDALSVAVAHLNSGAVHVVDADLKGYFDTIPHSRLVKAVHRKVTDPRVLGLIEAFLKAGVMESGEVTEPEAGTPQGGVISPLLANIYLNDLDHLMAGKGLAMVRYADDFVIFCQTAEEAQRALGIVRDWTVQAVLELHPTKTRVVDMGQIDAYVDFLGYRFKRHRRKDGSETFLRLVRPKSLDRIKDSVRRLSVRTSGDSLPTMIGWLNSTLRGWFGYFRSAQTNIHEHVDEMVRRRLRSILCKRLGVSSFGTGIAHQRWPTATFTKLGLFSLVAARAEYFHSRRGTR